MAKRIYTNVGAHRLGAQLTQDGKQVAVWYVNGGNIGLYNIERFKDGKLTASTLTAALLGGK